jgi:anti-anti-sigma regulatory factor
MYRITSEKDGGTPFMVSGQMDSECVVELKRLFSREAEGRRIVLDLSELTLVNEDVVRFLASCETDGIELKNCPAYIREWMKRERGGS